MKNLMCVVVVLACLSFVMVVEGRYVCEVDYPQFFGCVRVHLDADHDDRLSREELDSAIDTNTQWYERGRYNADKIMRYCDTDGDGHLTQIEGLQAACRNLVLSCSFRKDVWNKLCHNMS